MPSGVRSRALRPPQGGTTGSASASAPAASSRCRVPSRSSTSTASRTGPGDAPAGLDPVDALGLSLVEQLERRPAGLEQDHPSVLTPPVGELLEPEGVAVERDCLVEVRYGEHDSQLHPRINGLVHGSIPLDDDRPRRVDRPRDRCGLAATTRRSRPPRGRRPCSARRRAARRGADPAPPRRPPSRRARGARAWIPAKPSSSTRPGPSPSSSRICGVAEAARAGGSRGTSRDANVRATGVPRRG